MANINPSIVGEPYKKYVKDQIKVRQKVHASGLGNNDRTPQEISYLNSKNAWIKCASSVSIEDSKRLTDIGLNESLKGIELAKKFVLFNGVQEYNDNESLRGGYNTGDNPNTEDINELLLPGTAYGVGGLDFGQQPMPGILDFTLTHNDIGSIRFGQLKIRANNKLQFEILELLYVRLGYTIFVEWGNNMYFENPDDPTLKFTGVDTVTLIDDGTWFEPTAEVLTHLGFFNKIEEKREAFKGNYDAFFGRVVNFDWTFHPSGYYEIDLVLRDLGDVVESFKTNALTKKNTLPNITTSDTLQSQANETDIRNYLYCLETTFNEEFTPFNTEDNNSDFVNVSELFKSDPVTSTVGTSTVRNPGISLDTSLLYIRFGTFLEWLEENVICHITNQTETFPMLTISTSESNFMRVFPGLVSTNPKVCVIKNDFLGKFENQKIGDNDIHNKIFSKFKSVNSKENSYKGKIMDIYLNIEELESTFMRTLGSSPDVDVDLLTLLNSVLTTINKCFGGYIDLKVGIQEGNVLIIRDTKLETRTDSEGKRFEKEQDDADGIIKVFGFDPGSTESNFVRNFRFNTRISNRLAAQISIGAASNRTNTTNISGFFENLNKGLKDRFQEKTQDNNPDAETEEFMANCQAGESDKNVQSQNPVSIGGAFISSNSRGTRSESDTAIGSESNDNQDKTDIEVARENLSEASNTYFQLLSFMFGTTESQSQYDSKYFRYFRPEGKFETRGQKLSSALQKYLGASKVYLEKKTGSSLASTTLGFIPIDISITLDGISGIKIYNQLSIDAKFLPKPYPQVIDFVIMNVSHKISSNSWETELRAISKPNNSKTDIEALDELLAEEQAQQLGPEQGPEEEPIAEDVDNLTYYPPLGTFPFNIRDDGDVLGRGFFGASREGGTRTHEGIDLSTQISNTSNIDLFKSYPYLAPRRKQAFANVPKTGTVAPTTNIPDAAILSGTGNIVYAPITGTMTPTSANSTDSILPGIKIVGIGKYKGIVVKILYAAPNVTSYGLVRKGQQIGNAIDITLQPKYANLTNHVHYAVYINGKAVDPQQLQYDFEKDSQKVTSLIFGD